MMIAFIISIVLLPRSSRAMHVFGNVEETGR